MVLLEGQNVTLRQTADFLNTVLSIRVPKQQGYFVTERSSESFSQKEAIRNGVPEPFVPGIGIPNTIPLRPNSGPLFEFWDLFQEKHSAAEMQRISRP
jgi:hypothetical protein